ncbi:hypothetical protein BHM03_00042037 [Ensete ventricosum]|nr:hypothetical protein BHM03_00042037 [Ensete ventricosum]
MTLADVKALSALEAIKSFHDLDSIMSLESLATIRKRSSILTEYVLHAPAPRQRPYHTCPEGFNISIDALEAGLRFSLHPIIVECLGWWRISPSQVASNSWRYLITFLGELSMSLMRGQLKVGGGCPGTTSSTSITAPMLAQPTDSPSPSEVQEIPPGEATKKAPEASGKHPASGRRLKSMVDTNPTVKARSQDLGRLRARSQPPWSKGHLLLGRGRSR